MLVGICMPFLGTGIHVISNVLSVARVSCVRKQFVEHVRIFYSVARETYRMERDD